MGHVREHRAARIFEETLLEWLEEGQLPTVEELKEAYNASQLRHGDFTRSALRQVSVPQRWSESSASQHNSVIDAVDGDLHVLLRSLVSITDLGITNLGKWNSRAKALSARIENLKSRIESLILIKSDSAGYVSFVEENFLSLENVSSDTTANIDTLTGEVTLNVDSSEGEGEWLSTQIDLGSGSEITWNLIETNNIRYSAHPAGSSLPNIASDRLNRFGMEANSIRPNRFRTANSAGKPIMGELKIKLAEEIEVSRIVLITSDATAGDNSVIGAQFSIDGYTWENVPSDSPVQSGTGNFIWRFEKTSMKWVKLICSKASPDQELTDQNTYDFGFESIKIYSEQYENPTEGVQVVSETMTPTLGGSDVTFGRASLEVCEEVPSEASLRYFLRAWDGGSYTEWVPVSPLTREVEGAPAVVDFTSPTSLSSEDLTDSFDSSLDIEALNILRVDGAGSFSYRFGGPNETVANFYLAQSDNFLTDFVLLRNRGYSAAKYPTSSSGDLLVGDIQCGWGLEGDSVYYCTFLVNNPDGLPVDFGASQAELDGEVVDGAKTILAGWHTFKTDRANWAPIYNATAPTSATELEAIDPLYPYNHKYLIEGYDYPATWPGDSVYLGADEYGQYRSTRVGRHNFLNAETDLSIYALDVISGPKTLVLLKFDSSRPNHENERVRLFYTRRFDSFAGVQTKAVLNTQDARKTPVLSYYRVRVK